MQLKQSYKIARGVGLRLGSLPHAQNLYLCCVLGIEVVLQSLVGVTVGITIVALSVCEQGSIIRYLSLFRIRL